MKWNVIIHEYVDEETGELKQIMMEKSSRDWAAVAMAVVAMAISLITVAPSLRLALWWLCGWME